MARQNAVDLGPKLVSAEKALATIRPGSRVYLGTGCAAPRSLIAGLEAMLPGPADLELVSFVTTSALPQQAGAPHSRYRHRAFFVGSDVRDLAGCGKLDYVPISLEEVPMLLASGLLPIDVALLQVSLPDVRGFVSLGVSVDLAPAVLGVARRVIAEVNPAMPRTHGESFVHLDRFDALVSVDAPLAEYRHPETGEVAERVARYIASIIEDGSTLQIGLGRVPNEALRHLTDRRDLGIHSDVITDAVVDLMEAGVVTGRRKTRHRDRIVASYCLGTRRLYDVVDDNPRFAFLPIDQVCDPQEVAANAHMVSITQAFAVDLTGQVCVDQFEGEFYGGVSTQAGFIRGAARSPGGKPIICLASTTDDGASRIKPLLEAGDGVGIARSDVHYVVTEYGIAYLFGKSIRERAVALIELAHPRWRDELLATAKRLGYVPPGARGANGRAEERHQGPDPAGSGGRRGCAAGVVPSALAGRRLHALLPAREGALLCGAADALQRQPRERGRLPGHHRATRKRGGRRQRLLLPEPDHEPRRGRLHGRARMAGSGPWKRLAGAPPGVCRGPRRPRVRRRDPAAKSADAAPGRPRAGHGDDLARRGRGPCDHPVLRPGAGWRPAECVSIGLLFKSKLASFRPWTAI
jgi:acyl-CoA hydrolase